MPLSLSSVFLLASVSKQFVVFLIMLLAQNGRLSLDDDVRKHVPEVPDFGKKVTIRHLIHHTSGLRGPDLVQPRRLAIGRDHARGFSAFSEPEGPQLRSPPISLLQHRLSSPGDHRRA